jgi:NADH-quinone oxidoreductase subunit L
VAISATGLALIAIGISWLIYGRKTLEAGQKDPLAKALGPIFTGMNNKWYVDEIYQATFINGYQALARFLAHTIDWKFWHDWFHDSVIAKGFKSLAHFLANPIDLGIIDGIANGLATLIQDFSKRLGRLQTGFVRNYALSLFVGVILILTYLVFFT